MNKNDLDLTKIDQRRNKMVNFALHIQDWAVFYLIQKDILNDFRIYFKET